MADLNPLSWLSSAGGDVASGIEEGFVAFLQDLWDIISGPILVIAGIWVAIITLGIYFRRPIGGLVRMVGGAAIRGATV